MEQTRPLRQKSHRNPFGRIAAAALVVGGLSLPIVAVSTASAATSHSTKGLVISTFKNKKFGTFLVSGETLYTLTPGSTPCAAECHKIWPQVLLPQGVTKATAGHGVDAAKLGTVKLSDGALQVTYSGKALYWFYKDTTLGQVNGNGKDKWGSWYYVATVKPASSSGTGGVAF
jgi:predicted lipoprotein with Yx(FWY)xxD motif